MKTQLKRKTPAQKKAFDNYMFSIREEDRYMGSVFVNHIGIKRVEDRTAAAYQACLTVGLTEAHGLW